MDNEKEDFNFDDIDEVELNTINSKNITSLINGTEDTGHGDDAGPETATDDSENAMVGVLDMMVKSSGDLMKRYDLPGPNLTIWNEWAKPNLNRAVNHYFPASSMEVESPAVAAAIGITGLVLAFSPPIFVLIKRKIDEDKRKQEEAKKRNNPVEPAEVVYSTEPVNYTVTKPIEDNEQIPPETQAIVNRLNELGQKA